MILFSLFTLLLLPPDADSIRKHLAEALKLKCDSLLYRSHYFNDRCYFSASEEVEERNATARCSSILPGAKALNMDLSNVHLETVSRDKNLLCVLAPTKMNFLQANQYCKDRGMGIPAPRNELENQIVRDTMIKGPVWIQKSLTRENGFKWSQETGYSRWTTCDANASQKYVGPQKSKSSCKNDTASVIDQNGYWGNSGAENLMDVVCDMPAYNDFTNAITTNGDEKKITCNYHEDSINSAEIFTALPVNADHASKTCYTSNLTTTRYDIMGRATVETQRGCEALCDTKKTCAGFSFKDAGFSSTCVLLSVSKNTDHKCPASTNIFLKKTSGCQARTNLGAELGVDPCIYQFVPLPPVKPHQYSSICPVLNGEAPVLRAVTSSGRRISLSTYAGAQLVVPSDGMWKYTDHFGYTLKLVAAVCASVLDTGLCSCGAAPTYRANAPRAQISPAVVNRLNPCSPNTPNLDFKNKFNDGVLWTGASDVAGTRIACKAGVWFILYGEPHRFTIGISEAACY